MKICKVCNEEAKYPHYVSNDGSVICERCKIQGDIETSIPVIVDNVKKVDTWNKLFLVRNVAGLINVLEEDDIQAIDYILKNIRDRR